MRIAFVNQDRGIAPDREKGAAVHLGALRSALRGRGAEVLCFDQPDNQKLIAELEHAWSERSFDLVYERYALGKDTACRFAGLHRVPFALEVNAPLLEEAARWRKKRVSDSDRACEAFLMREARKVFAVSDSIGNYARSVGATNVEVCPNGVDLELFYPRPVDDLRASLIPADRLVVGFHGRLRPWHGIEILGAALARSIKKGLPVHLLTIGRGDYREQLADCVPESHHTHVEWVAHVEVARYVACFDVIPLCYPGPVYFSPLKLAEGMAAGAVPVVPNGGDWERFLADDENALYYSTGNYKQLSNCFIQLHRDSPRFERLSAGSRETAHGLSWNSIAERVMSVAEEECVRNGAPT